MVTRSGTLCIKDEDTWQPPKGPRQVRCHQCDWWVGYEHVSYRGVFEHAEEPARGDDTVTECWWCFMQRKQKDCEFTESEVKSMFKDLRPLKRGDRVKNWQHVQF